MNRLVSLPLGVLSYHEMHFLSTECARLWCSIRLALNPNVDTEKDLKMVTEVVAKMRAPYTPRYGPTEALKLFDHFDSQKSDDV